MRTESYVMLAALAISAVPAAGQIADRAVQSRDRRGAVVVAPRPSGQGSSARGRGRGAVVVVPPGRAGRSDRGNNRCRDDYRRRDGRHEWFERDNRFDCDYRYDQRRPVGVAFRTSIEREHTGLLAELDRAHERWHRSHGWYPRNRGWQKSHDALHRRLERDHERWHRRTGVPFTLRADRFGYDNVPGRGRGFVVIR